MHDEADTVRDEAEVIKFRGKYGIYEKIVVILSFHGNFQTCNNNFIYSML